MIKEAGFEFTQRVMLELKWKPENEEPSSDEEPVAKKEENEEGKSEEKPQ